MNKRNWTAFCAFLCALLLTGCGQAKVPDVVDTPSLAVDKDGTVTSYLVDVFDKEYYNIDGLAAMVSEEAAAYNAQKQSGETEPVFVEKVEELEDGSGKVVVVLKYDSTDTFSDYNNGVLFYGTIAQAQEEGYELEAADAEDGQYVLITDQKVKLYCPRKAVRAGGGAVLEEDGSVDASAAENMAYVFMK